MGSLGCVLGFEACGLVNGWIGQLSMVVDDG